jgi:hypothetical protein
MCGTESKTSDWLEILNIIPSIIVKSARNLSVPMFSSRKSDHHFIIIGVIGAKKHTTSDNFLLRDRKQTRDIILVSFVKLCIKNALKFLWILQIIMDFSRSATLQINWGLNPLRGHHLTIKKGLINLPMMKANRSYTSPVNKP